MTLDPDYTIDEVAAALGMSDRWLRAKMKADKLAHQRYGHKIKFTAEQVEAIRSRYAAEPAPAEQITTGKKKRSASA